MTNQNNTPSPPLSGSLPPRPDKQSLSENHPRYRLTKLGEQMARLPIDPKIARILLAAKKHDCMAEILVIASALSIQDPRERPLEAREAAAKAHERFTDKQSDFLAYLNIWDSFQRERDKGLSNKQLVQWCHQYFLSHLRMREWRELHRQLAEIAIEMGLASKEQAFRRPPVQEQLRPSENQGDQDLSAKLKQKQLDKKQHRAQIRAHKEAGYEQIHRALLTGLIANVGMKSPDGHDYTGARGSHFHLFPASALFKSKPKWVMAAELTETTRLYARDVAAIQPEWIEQEAPHLVKYHYFEPHWEQKRGEVVASERVTLYGLTVLPRRPVSYGRVAPEEAREIFIRSALVAQECDLKADFFVHNKKLIREIAELEHKSRKQDVLVDEEALFDFYNTRLPKTVWQDKRGGVWSEEGQPEIQRLPENANQTAMPDNGDTPLAGSLHPEPLPEYCRPKIRIADDTEQRDRLCRLLVAQNQHDLATWAMRCVQHVLPLLPDTAEAEAVHAAFALLERWQNGKADVAQLRQTGFALHKLAKEQQNPVATAVLRAAGQAVGVGHMKEHAPVCGDYAVKTVGLANGQNPQAVSQERQWQFEQLQQIAAQPSSLHPERLPENTTDTFSDDPHPISGSLKTATPSEKQKQPAPQKGRLKPLPLADIRTFQAWLQTAERDNPRLLFLSRDDLMQHAAAHITEEQFPKFYKTPDGKFKLSYRFEPHHPLDGVTLTVPLTVLNRINLHQLEWLVSGMLREKLALLIKVLPKQIRRVCVPVPEFVTQFLLSEPDQTAPILPQLAHAIAKHAGDMRLLEQINLDEWAAFRLPEHCYFNLRVVDDGGQELATSRDLIQLQQKLGQVAAVTFRDNTQEFERDNVSNWDIGTLPESIKFARGKQQLTGYLGLQKQKDGTIALRLFDTELTAEHAHRLGVIELMKLQLKEQVKDLNKGLLGFTQIAMNFKHIPVDILREDITQAVCQRAFLGEDALPRDEKAFKEQIKRARSRLPAVKEAMSRYLQELAQVYAELNSKLGKHPLTPILREQINQLIYQGFVSQTPWQQWQRMAVYLHAMLKRMEKYSANPARDQAREDDIQELYLMWQEKVNALKMQGKVVSEDVAQFYWQLQELRVSLFAQELKTPYPVSVKRLWKELDFLS